MTVVRFKSTYEEPYPIQVVGGASYRANIENLFGIVDVGIVDVGIVDGGGVNEDYLTATLILEVNPQDADAVRVEIDDQQVGYLPQSVTKRYRQELKRLGLDGVVGQCGASVHGGFRQKDGQLADFEIRLDFDLDHLQVDAETRPKPSSAFDVIRPPPNPVKRFTPPTQNVVPMVTAPPRRKWKPWQAILIALGFCGCLGLWVLAKLSGY